MNLTSVGLFAHWHGTAGQFRRFGIAQAKKGPAWARHMALAEARGIAVIAGPMLGEGAQFEPCRFGYVHRAPDPECPAGFRRYAERLRARHSRCRDDGTLDHPRRQANSYSSFQA